MKISFFSLSAALLLMALASCSTARRASRGASLADEGKREFRGAWIQTVYQGEYKEMGPEKMKRDFIRKLDELRRCGINAILFQVRPEADAFYPSSLEPWSRFYTGRQGVAPDKGFDPMAFLIQECHKRGMEFHAWLNPFRAWTSGEPDFADSHVYNRHPEWFVRYGKQTLFDPGLPGCRRFICKVVSDIVTRYDVDAIHIDDYFYPYPVAGAPFPDNGSFRAYGLPKGYTEAQRDDWRRENVNTVIREMKRSILRAKPWVRFGVSPFGIYRNKKSDPDGSDTNGLQNYDDLYADVIKWAKEGWIDYNVPQIYWEIGHPAADYVTLVKWWDKHACGRPLYIGQSVERTMKAGELARKMSLAHELPHIDGNCFWPANEILWNTKGAADSLRRNYHRYPALIPAYTHMHDRTPGEVKRLRTEWTKEGLVLRWDAEQDAGNPELARYFVVYRFEKGERVNLNNPAKIVSITDMERLLLPYKKGIRSYRYVVTAVDRFHNESRKGKSKRVRL